MKTLRWIVLLNFLSGAFLLAQESKTHSEKEQQIISLVDKYAQARATKDTTALNQILIDEVDQLVSTGEWRRGIDESLAGMLRSSTRQPGSRSLTVEYIRFITTESAIADARYVIKNSDGTERKMWSTFIVVNNQGRWQIAAIRNMLPRK